MLSPCFHRTFVGFASLLTLLTLLGNSPASANNASQDRIVVIVSVDGLAWYYLNDPKADLPTLRKLAAEGTVAEKMKASLPSMTWPNHTTLVTGVSPGHHGVIGNNYWNRTQMQNVKLLPDPIFNKDEIVKVPTVYDVVKAAGFKTAGINWPASRGAKTLDWTTPDVQVTELYQQYTTPSLIEEFRAAGIPFDKQVEFCKAGDGESRDRMYTQMLVHVIKKHRPNLAVIHLVEVDHVEHLKGPRSPEAYAAAKFADDRLQEIFQALEEGFPGKATLLVVSDHGFVPVRQRIQLNVKLRLEGLLKVEGTKITERKVFALDQGGSSFIYILDQANRTELLKKIPALCKDIEGIDQIIMPKDFKKHGLASPEVDPRMADIVVTAKEGFTFSENALGDVIVTPVAANTIGAHGHSPRLPDMHASFIAWGNGIKKGAKIGTIDNRDVTPTAAALLGVRMKNVEGRILKEILEKPETTWKH